MREAGQCVIELNGSIRTHVNLSFAFFMDAMPWIMSKTSGKRSAHSLNSPEDEICDLFRLGIAAKTVDLLDEVHVLFLCMRSFTLKRWLPVVDESGLQPEYLDSMWSFMLRNEVEVRIDLEDG